VVRKPGRRERQRQRPPKAPHPATGNG
jgi:hypothetical protein